MYSSREVCSTMMSSQKNPSAVFCSNTWTIVEAQSLIHRAHFKTSYEKHNYTGTNKAEKNLHSQTEMPSYDLDNKNGFDEYTSLIIRLQSASRFINALCLLNK